MTENTTTEQIGLDLGVADNQEETKEIAIDAELEIPPVHSDELPNIDWFDEHMKAIFNLESFSHFYGDV